MIVLRDGGEVDKVMRRAMIGGIEKRTGMNWRDQVIRRVKLT